LERKTKQDAGIEKQSNTGGTEAHTAACYSQGLDKNMLVVWFGLGPVHLHRALTVLKKKKRKKRKRKCQ